MQELIINWALGLTTLFELHIFESYESAGKVITNYKWPNNGPLQNTRLSEEMWIKIQQMQQYADIYLVQNYSTCFGCHSTHHQEY